MISLKTGAYFVLLSTVHGTNKKIKQSVNGKIVIKMNLRDFAKNTLKEMEGGFSPAIKIS